MKKRNSSEQGQALIFMVVVFIVLLGFVSLAIDGGMVYSDRRHDRNGADASSLAGGGAAALSLENQHVFYSDWNCADPRITTARQAAVVAAINRASSNGFTIDADVSDYNGVMTTCGQTDMGGYFDKYIDITTQISTTTSTSFVQYIYSGALRNQVEAVVRVRPRMPLAYGHAVVALNDAACNGNQNGAIFGGSSDVDINGGGVWSNGCLSGNGNDYDVNVTNGSVNYAGQSSGSMNFTPEQTQVPNPLPPSSYAIPAPNCSDPSAHNVAAHDLPSNLTPGLWCVTGDIRINGGDFTGTGVTIYLATDSVTINGNAETALASPSADPDPSPAIAGVLFYVAQGDISLEGNDTSSYLGVVYAPHGDIKVTGANGTTPTFNTQFIGNNVEVSGNADIDINFNAGQQYQKPSAIELYR